MITAHGGALGTGRNSKLYFDTIEQGKIVSDAIEVDVRGRDGHLYIAHLPTVFSKRCISLKFVCEFALKHKLLVNFDIKQKELFLPVMKLVSEMKAEEYLLYTGSTRPEHIKDLKVGQIYANSRFFAEAGLRFQLSDVAKIKDYIDSFKNPRLKGINISYKLLTEDFAAECKKVGLGVSVYTVDIEDELRRIIPYGFDNITTNRTDLVQKILSEGKNA
jgi:glycerophosphoryl diester phosphodiesterase